MSAQTSTETNAGTELRSEAVAGGVAGFLGGLVFAAVLTMTMPKIIAGAIPALWGLHGLAAGWVVHVVNATLFGVLFAAVVSNAGIDGYADDLTTSWSLGAGWGLLLWVGGAVLLMPLWLQAVGFPMAPPFPHVNPMTIPGHLVYGVVLGLLYPVVRGGT